jgi:hypothetical protein
VTEEERTRPVHDRIEASVALQRKLLDAERRELAADA